MAAARLTRLAMAPRPGLCCGRGMVRVRAVSKRFHGVYVGQIGLDNGGLNGTPANDRRYSNARLSEVFETSRRVAQVMDELGYYCFWAAEHHFQHEGYECIPNLVQW